jgi:hypothetical protein
MKQNRLDELMQKANDEKITLSEVAEIIGACLQSFSRHSNDIKAKIYLLEEQMYVLEEKLDMILDNQSPAFGVIVDDDEEMLVEEDEED